MSTRSGACTVLAVVAGNTIGNLLLLFLIPLAAYWGYQRRRHARSLGEVLRRAGLVVGEPRYLLYCFAASAAVVLLLVIWRPSPDTFGRAGSAQRPFVGAGLSGVTVPAALLYGVVQTGFCEEFFFRGLIAGSLARIMSTAWANLLQAVLFLLPHLVILRIMPEAAPTLVLVFAGALFTGWIRLMSSSILGPWALHATANVATALLVATG
jgi:membrane protease YdiL (CAAX protease family)